MRGGDGFRRRAGRRRVPIGLERGERWWNDRKADVNVLLAAMSKRHALTIALHRRLFGALAFAGFAAIRRSRQHEELRAGNTAAEQQRAVQQEDQK